MWIAWGASKLKENLFSVLRLQTYLHSNAEPSNGISTQKDFGCSKSTAELGRRNHTPAVIDVDVETLMEPCKSFWMAN